MNALYKKTKNWRYKSNNGVYETNMIDLGQ